MYKQTQNSSMCPFFVRCAYKLRNIVFFLWTHWYRAGAFCIITLTGNAYLLYQNLNAVFRYAKHIVQTKYGYNKQHKMHFSWTMLHVKFILFITRISVIAWAHFVFTLCIKNMGQTHTQIQQRDEYLKKRQNVYNVAKTCVCVRGRACSCAWESIIC